MTDVIAILDLLENRADITDFFKANGYVWITSLTSHDYNPWSDAFADPAGCQVTCSTFPREGRENETVFWMTNHSELNRDILSAMADCGVQFFHPYER